ncbi:MAG: AtpZ/AtpI family protein [Ferruginibacter sp.]
MDKKDNKNILWRYAGLGTQLLVAIGLCVFAGIKTDEWLGFKSPLAVWVLPLLMISVIIYKLIRDTAPKK